jgi:hypothetical protein
MAAGMAVLFLACSRPVTNGSTVATPAVQEEGNRASFVAADGSVITPEWAAQYVQNHGGGGRIDSAGQLTVEQALCAPAAEIRRWIGTTEGKSDDAPLCLVQIRGQFSVAWPGGHADHPALEGRYAQVLFDGRTGTVLLQACCAAASPSLEPGTMGDG